MRAVAALTRAYGDANDKHLVLTKVVLKQGSVQHELNIVAPARVLLQPAGIWPRHALLPPYGLREKGKEKTKEEEEAEEEQERREGHLGVRRNQYGEGGGM